MPKQVSDATKKAYYQAWVRYGSYDKAAEAMGVPRFRIVRAVYAIQDRCAECTRPLDRAGSLCSDCIAALRHRAHSLYQTRKKDGLCVNCGQPVNHKGYARCDRCNSRMSKTNQKRQKERKASGLCVQCGQPASAESSSYCDAHLVKMRAKGHHDRNHSYFGGNLDEALDRDGHCCQLCHSNNLRLEVHHVDGDSSHNDLSNLITLCRVCHASITFLSQCPDPKAVIDFFVAHKHV